jgi:GNAT superfamily N-acetyltransferase
MRLQHIEEAALSAWPALRQIIYDGWLLRFGGGYTKRSNSVNPLYDASFDLDEKIAYCEACYAEQNLPPTFRINSFAAPPGLDHALEQRGYRQVSPTLTQALDLSRAAFTVPDGLQDVPLIDTWLEHFCRLKGDPVEKHGAHKLILQAVPSRRFLGVMRDAAGDVVACGIAVQVGAYVGLYDIFTDPARRGQGHSPALIAGMLQWAKDGGARYAYLQVEAQNAAARRVYEAKLGFETVYHYAYRVAGND